MAGNGFSEDGERLESGSDPNKGERMDGKSNQSMWEQLSHETGVKARRKIKAQKGKNRGVWYALGMLGLVGWSVAIPPLVGVALGNWIDNRWQSDVSWTLMLFLIGLGLGLWNAWQWLKQEGLKTEKDQELEEENGIE
ncbi:MAG: AtpZ/AtpI family protein [Anaerolineales bacterium]